MASSVPSSRTMDARNPVRTKVPSGPRPGPLAGSDSSGSTHSLKPVISGEAARAVTVYRSRSGPERTRKSEPVFSAVSLPAVDVSSSTSSGSSARGVLGMAMMRRCSSVSQARAPGASSALRAASAFRRGVSFRSSSGISDPIGSSPETSSASLKNANSR